MIFTFADAKHCFLPVAGLYIHIPFCKSRCSYCDFFSGAQLAKKNQFVEALCKEIDLRSSYLKGESLQTIYFGGGTPSVLTSTQLSAIFEAIQQKWDLRACNEITLEANPDDLSEEKLIELSTLPINRLSIGIQSFNDEELALLRRRHTGRQAFEAVKRAQQHFSNISIDLMYGLPNQSFSSWQHTISQALSLNIQHISAYHLTYEAGTLLDRWQNEGKVAPVSEEISLEMYSLLVEMLHQQCIEQYEISNFALRGFHSRHNSSYWESVSYLGIGPSAHSFDKDSRQWNIANTTRYINGIEQGTPFFDKEMLTATNKYNELIMISLRTTKGLPLEEVANACGIEGRSELLIKAERYLKNGLMKLENNHLSLTTKSLFLSDGIIMNLMRD